MREIRQSGSEGGGIGHTDPPYPYPMRWLLTGIVSFANCVRVERARSIPATIELESQSFRQLV